MMQHLTLYFPFPSPPSCPPLLPQVDAVFTFSGGRIKPANRQYSSIKNDYEVTFNMSITHFLCAQHTYSISQWSMCQRCARVFVFSFSFSFSF